MTFYNLRIWRIMTTFAVGITGDARKEAVWREMLKLC